MRLRKTLGASTVRQEHYAAGDDVVRQSFTRFWRHFSSSARELNRLVEAQEEQKEITGPCGEYTTAAHLYFPPLLSMNALIGWAAQLAPLGECGEVECHDNCDVQPGERATRSSSVEVRLITLNVQVEAPLPGYY